MTDPEASSQLRQTSVTVWAVQQRTWALCSTGHGLHNDGGGGAHLIVPVVSLHRCQLQLQAGHLGHQLQFLGLEGCPLQQLLWNETHFLFDWSTLTVLQRIIAVYSGSVQHADLLVTGVQTAGPGCQDGLSSPVGPF